MPTAALARDDQEHAPLPRLGAILEVLRQRTGTDFSCYRPATIARRVRNRMLSVGIDCCGRYLERLRTDAGEAMLLLGRITIKVSRFYRNAATFDRLRADVFPELAGRAGVQPLRVWSAGCGCGEEAYTLAMLLEEAGLPGQVHATDIDPAALAVARAGLYGSAAVEELPVELGQRFLTRVGADQYQVVAPVRARVRFSHHDLSVAGPVAAPVDLLCCRNVLIYFDRPVQQQALWRLRTALAPGGFLCLGEAEWPMPDLAATLEPLGHNARIFRARHAQLPPARAGTHTATPAVEEPA